MRFHALIAALVLLVAAVGAHTERLAYPTRPGKAAYNYDFTIAGQIQPPRGVPMPVALRMRALIVDQVTGKAQKGLSPVTMTIKDVRINGSASEDEFSDAVGNCVLRFLRTPSGILSNLRYVSAPAEADMPIPSLGNAWLLFSRFGHHLRLPEKELRAGEKWLSTETIGLETGRKMTLKTESTLVGYKSIHGKRYVRIDSTFQLTARQTLPMREGKAKTGIATNFTMTGKSMLLFDPRAGEVFRATVKADVTTKSSDAKSAVNGRFRVTGTALKDPTPAPVGKNR